MITLCSRCHTQSGSLGGLQFNVDSESAAKAPAFPSTGSPNGMRAVIERAKKQISTQVDRPCAAAHGHREVSKVLGGTTSRCDRHRSNATQVEGSAIRFLGVGPGTIFRKPGRDPTRLVATWGGHHRTRNFGAPDERPGRSDLHSGLGTQDSSGVLGGNLLHPTAPE